MSRGWSEAAWLRVMFCPGVKLGRHYQYIDRSRPGKGEKILARMWARAVEYVGSASESPDRQAAFADLEQWREQFDRVEFDGQGVQHVRAHRHGPGRR
ncbi:hypothetical protein J7F03_28220 [Streptomyces sp. ISL-43]|uniref:hypothetical protein n=1 Tax=Streptomyces sp. ISL-43 TaxID=2819183 RepID=UPI001BE5B5B2|nr:hypothetical protein [Streptomyces sp. ISL-43]MBT2450891.1 hypothetical protein [Streptomyces sp. ISL-43]